LDDGVVLRDARQGLAASFNPTAGRIMPVYWLHNWLLYRLGGANPTIWYTIQCFEFLLAAILLYLAVARLSRRWPAAALAAAVMLTSSPISENAYTISKAEPRVTLALAAIALILASILRGALLDHSAQPGGLTLRLLWIALWLAGMIVVFSKESAITLATLGPFGVFFSCICLPRSRRASAVKTFLLISALLFSASFLLLSLRATVLQGTENAYTAFNPDWEVAIGNLRFYVNESPDVLITAAVCLVLGIGRLWTSRRARPGRQSDEASDIEAVLGWTFLLTGMFYLLLLLLWRWPMNYYMLPVAACTSLSLGFLVASSGFKTQDIQGRSLRWGTTLLAVVVGVTRLYSIPYAHFVATAQRGFDVIEDEVSREVIRINPIHRRVIDVERASFVEQPIQRNLLYRVQGNSDVSWVGGGELFQEYPEATKRLYGFYKPSPLEDSPPRIGDLILIQGSTYPFRIMLRGIGPHVTSIELAGRKVEALEERIGASLVDLRTWHYEWGVYKPWTLQRAKLVFQSVLYKASGPLDHSPTRLSGPVEGPS
jgi:hypothetical protein